VRSWSPPGIGGTTEENGDANVADNLPVNDAVPTERQAIIEVLHRAERGDAASLPVLRELLKNPKVVKACGGDLARRIEDSLITSAAGNNLAFREALVQKTSQMRADLAGDNPTAMELLLVERIVTSWLHLHLLQLEFVQNGEISLRDDLFRQRVLDGCQKRYFAAIKALAVVRKLGLPVLQVNIGRNQVNLAQASAFSPLEAEER
jgi:hypothetical protein